MNKKMNTSSIWLTIGLLVPILLLSACAFKNAGNTSKLRVKDLPEGDQKFYKYVSYIMTRSEKKKFFSLVTDEARQEFRREFWKKRDPDSGTPENEYKKRYFARVAEANRLFSKGKYEGFRSDMGRVLILLGPPEFKRIYPTGYRVGDLPMEIWLYGYYNYPIVFVDRTRSGHYEMTVGSARNMAELNKAKVDFNPMKGITKNPFGFSLRLYKDKKANTHNMQILIPLRNIVFQEDKEGFAADVDVHIKITDRKSKKTQTMDKKHTISMTADQLEKLKDNYIFTIPLNLAPGKYESTVIIESKPDNITVQDKIHFKI